jgi:hypothetical protein
MISLSDENALYHAVDLVVLLRVMFAFKENITLDANKIAGVSDMLLQIENTIENVITK